MTVDRPKVLLFADDAGAANYVASALSAFRKFGAECTLLGDGPGCDQLAGHRLDFVRRAEGDQPETFLDGMALAAVGTSSRRDSFSLRLIARARDMSVPTIGLIDAAQNLDWRFRGKSDSPLGHAPDWIAAPDADSAKAFASMGFSPSRLRVCGHPHYDKVRADANAILNEGLPSVRRRVFPNALPDQKVVVFASSPEYVISDRNPLRRDSSYTLTGFGDLLGRTEIVAEELLAALHDIAPAAFSVFRHHPAAAHLFGDIASRYAMVSRGGLPSEILMAADLVVGSTTMLLHEAIMCGKPALSVVPRAVESAWLPAVRHGLIDCVFDRPSLREALHRALENPVLPKPERIADLFPFHCADLLLGLVADAVGGTAS